MVHLYEELWSNMTVIIVVLVQIGEVKLLGVLWVEEVVQRGSGNV